VLDAELQQQQQQQQHSMSESPVKVFVGPCLLPAYALPWQQQHCGAAGTAASGSSNVHAECHQAGSDSSGSSSSSSSRSSSDGPQQQVHPVWLRAHRLCVVFRMRVSVVQQLCEACPQLWLNLQQLLQPISGA
jgi:hypothetical protein